MIGIRHVIVCALAAFIGLTSVPGARAQSENCPNRAIRFIVGFAAGGGNDLFARLVVLKMQEMTGTTVIVENRPGAGGRIAAEYASHQPPDGCTVLVGATGQMSIAAAIYPKLGYHPTTSFIPLNMIASFPLVLVIPADHPAKTVKELVAWAKAHPDKANYATSSPAFTIATELLKLKTGMPGVAIPYKSSNESTVSVAGGQTLFTISDGPPAIPLVKGGKVRALAVTGSERSPELPDVPSMADVGYPEVNTQLWSGFFVPAGTPQPVVAKLEAALGNALADSHVKDGLKKMAVKPGGPTGDAFKRFIDADIKTFADVVAAAKLTFPQ
ncbi:MAG TPA: tripartite tricarboxylate transporter substrate binding protein [Pseudolabrys sp.]|jgi:tripartite-type tricarboxylate transporter receptor subunit TctC|nr:tripartite tricarboxylate transporter substrate binding protein [Pseudolabrys sp.]